MVVLNENNVSPDSSIELGLVKAFEEKATVIAKHFWLKDKDVGDCGLNYVHDYGLIHKWGLTPQELMMTT